jgi:GDP-L-fucose synthase
MIQRIVGHRGDIIWDTSKPDGTPRKLLDVSRIHSEGWHHRITLTDGLEETYDWFLKHQNELKEVKLQK